MAGIGFGAFCFSVNEWWLEATKTMALSRTDAITIGTVSTIDQRESSQSFQGYWSRSRVNYAIASYEVRGQTYSVTLNDSWVELQPPRYEVGQSVSIVYLSNHPEVSCLNTWSGIWKGFIQRSLVLLVGF